MVRYDLFYISNPCKRLLISIAGILFEFMFLIFILFATHTLIDPFFLQLLTVRVFLSALFNLNIFSQASDGHVLLTDFLGFTTFAESYSDYIRSVLNKKFIPAVPINKRVKTLFIIYTVIGIFFIGSLIITQIVFFEHIVDLLIAPLIQVQFYQNIGFIDLLLLVLTFLYYIDLVVRFYEKRVILTNMLKIRQNEEL